MARQIKSKKPIAIIDYGMGNLSSVRKAIQYLQADAVITASPRVIAQSDKVILPGVGAFGDAMKELRSRKLIQPLLDHVQRHKKLLGICLGLQLLFEKSEESRSVRGLGIMRGSVKRFRTKKEKVPHMGWNNLHSIADHPVLDQITKKDYFYFVHSYYAVPQGDGCFAECVHGDESFTAIAAHNNAIAVQFHPEKSQDSGLRLLKNFIRWAV